MIIDVFRDFFLSTGLFNLDLKSFAMIIVALIFIYLAIKKGFEPLLLVPIGFGMLLSNIPLTGIFDAPSGEAAGGLFYYFYKLDEIGILPPLVFMGIGAMTDFSPLLANPKSLLLGAGAPRPADSSPLSRRRPSVSSAAPTALQPFWWR